MARVSTYSKLAALMLVLDLASGGLLAGRNAYSGEIGFVEDFALAADRAAALRQLVPGTEDYYYYHCIHFQNLEQYDKVEPLLTAWVARHGETPRVHRIRTRQALLTYEKNPQQSLEYLRNRLQLQFQHQKEVLGAEPNLPTKLDPQSISRQALLELANSQPNTLEPFTAAALDWLIAVELNPERRRHLLQLLDRPDYAPLPKLVVDDLNFANSPGFGAFAIHRKLLLAQLDECLRLKPDLLNQQNFVNTYLAKLRPAADDDWRHDHERMEAFLDRVIGFADRLAPVHNSLKAHLAYHRLLLDHSRGRFDRQRFLKYLQLPRLVPYGAKVWLERDENRRFAANLASDFQPVTLLPPIGTDEGLVRAMLLHFLAEAKDTKEFEPYINDIYLKHLFAEAKIVNGLGEPEQWASLLPPQQFQQLRERVDLDFASDNRRYFGADDPVRLELDIKNVSTLLVKVYEINTEAYYRQNQREVETDINLDGLVANEELTRNYSEPPFRRVRRQFEFPRLNRPGVYVVDFIGNGRSSRAVIRKGKLRKVSVPGPSGHEFTVLSERNEQLKNATVWLSGQEYLPDQDGRIIVPYSSTPALQPVVIAHEGFACLDQFQHLGESYEFRAGIFVDRESLLKRKKATLIVRPGLFLNGTPVSLAILKDATLVIQSNDLDGVPSIQEVPGFTLYEDRETTHEFQVPQRLATIQFTVQAKVKSLLSGQESSLADSNSFSLNAIDRTEKIEDLHLSRFEDVYVVEVLGKSGEPKASRPVQFSFQHRDFKQPLPATLKTDAAGRVHLGQLSDIVAVTATGPEGTSETWRLPGDHHSYAQSIHARQGDAIVLPYLGKQDKPTREEFSLLELRDEEFVADRFEALSIVDGLVNLSGLAPGDYHLESRSGGTRRIMRVRVVAGQRVGSYIVGKVRQLEIRPSTAPQIYRIATEKREQDGKQLDFVTIQLKNHSKFTRVHLFGTRFWPAEFAFQHLGRVSDSEPYFFLRFPLESHYLTGRNIGDEYSYIINRKYAGKFPGNMLERPSLLLNPWAVRATETAQQLAAGGDNFAPKAMPAESAEGRSGAAAAAPAVKAGEHWNLDFLAQEATVLTNLSPDDEGWIRIPLSDLQGHHQLHLIAVEPGHTTYRALTLPEQETRTVDLRLLRGFDPEQHFTQQKQISVLREGDQFVIDDVTTSRFEIYDSLAKVYNLYGALSKNAALAEFRFIVEWPKHELAEKRTFYSKFASHELNFFLARKDPEFFQQVVVPYLRNKKDTTFLDEWLIGGNLSAYLQPWRYGQLNTAERVLLGQRIEAERPRARRHLSDQFQLLPPNLEQFLYLFDAAVKGRALDAEAALGTKLAMLEAEVLADHLEVSDQNGQLGGLGRPGAPAGAAGVQLRAGGAGGGFGDGRGGRADRAATKGDPQDAGAEREMSEKKLADNLSRDGRIARKRAEADASGKANELKQADKAGLFYRQRGEDELRRLYRKLDKTQEWAENNYHHLTIDQQHAGLIPVSAFWRDAADQNPDQPFLSNNLAEAARNFPEMLLALGLLDLPFRAASHEIDFEGVRMTLKAAGPIVLYHEQIRNAMQAAGPQVILVSQNFFRHGDRYRQENNEQVDKFVTEEFLTHTVYGCQIVLTNPSSARQKLGALLQIPRGAIPVLNGQHTRTVHLQLEPYHTQTLEYYFYFPAPGKLAHYPVQIAKNGEFVGAAPAFTFNVVETPARIDTESWEHVSQNGSTDDVLRFLNTNNVGRLNLEKIAFRMKDPKVFSAVTEVLTQRHVFHPTLWSYSLMHNAVPAIREYLQHQDLIANECGGRIRSALLEVDPVLRRSYEHLEYRPLVNPRSHVLGKRRQILNDRFDQQYHRCMEQLALSAELSNEDWLDVVYYLLLQDRVEEALRSFDKINAEKLPTRIQYDYAAAYLDFFHEVPKQARAIAERYVEHPVDRWRIAFTNVLAQLDELEGKGVKAIDGDDRNQQQGLLAATEPNFEMQIEARQLQLQYQNLRAARVNYYLMDVELLFSHNPFVQQYRGQFSSIRPNQSQNLELPADTRSLKVPIPEALHNKNVLVEVTAGGQTKTQAYYSHTLATQIVENYGQVRVNHSGTGKPIAKAYVKVYAQFQDGQVRFYKDGYTDLRGRFDYASLSTNEIDQVQRFSILIMTDDAGATVREANPPKQ